MPAVLLGLRAGHLSPTSGEVDLSIALKSLPKALWRAMLCRWRASLVVIGGVGKVRD